MNFSDIFNSRFLEKTASFSFLDTAISLGVSFILGLFIFYIYKKTFSGVMYSRSFGISLVAMTLITSLIITAVCSNVILSLGMVGALSIVRFRTAIKEPMDIAFLFWAIAAGIVTGAGLIPLALLGSLFIAVVMFIFANCKTSYSPYILVSTCNDEETEKKLLEVVESETKKHIIKSKSISMNGIETTIEVRLTDGKTDFVNAISSIEGVHDATLVSYNGDYMS